MCDKGIQVPPGTILQILAIYEPHIASVKGEGESEGPRVEGYRGSRGPLGTLFSALDGE